MKNKDGLWRISPSGLYAYTECQACWWVNNHFKRVPSFPLLLNSAMDSILKARYDKYRAKGEFPPEAKELADEGMKPWDDLDQLNEWRERLEPLEVVNEEVGYRLVGKIDDVLVDPTSSRLRGAGAGALVPADYKSSGNAPKEDKQKYYIDQLTAYGLMFKKHGHEVSDRAYLLHYFVKDKNNPSTKVEFDSHVDLVSIDVDGLEKKLVDMVKVLDGEYPGHNPECQMCGYLEGRREFE